MTRLVSSIKTFGFKINSIVQVENTDVLDSSFDSEIFLLVSQVLKLLKFGFRLFA